jgi:hypothetical protein
MDIFKAVSDGKIVFYYPQNGMKGDVDRAEKYQLKVGKTYTIDFVDTGSWSTDVFLKEIPNVAFNSVQFVDLQEYAKVNNES